MESYEITAMTHARNNSETRLTICRVDEKGSQDAFEDVTVVHDRLGSPEEMMDDITEYIDQRQAELDREQLKP